MGSQDLKLTVPKIRSTMPAFKVEQMIFLRLNQDFLPEVRKYNAVRKAQKKRYNKGVEDLQLAQGSAADEVVEM